MSTRRRTHVFGEEADWPMGNANVGGRRNEDERTARGGRDGGVGSRVGPSSDEGVVTTSMRPAHRPRPPQRRRLVGRVAVAATRVQHRLSCRSSEEQGAETQRGEDAGAELQRSGPRGGLERTHPSSGHSPPPMHASLCGDAPIDTHACVPLWRCGSTGPKRPEEVGGERTERVGLHRFSPCRSSCPAPPS
ncbi:hypothetical protein VTK73DRAFT_5821 [Phialemonium thermophilum]|uniref:Uncharacterized protein n=1 Tax=Phialemonium thermophilum TaxID=223376 RepID=A0ABR3V119_9PEZI